MDRRVCGVAVAAGSAALTLLTTSSAGSAGEGIRFSSAWQRYAVPRAERVAARAVVNYGGLVSNLSGALGKGGPALLRVATTGAPSYFDVDFGREVAGQLELHFAGASHPPPLVHVAFSETREYLNYTSDYSRHQATDDHVPAPQGETWRDDSGCQYPDACSDGIRGFRFARIWVSPWRSDGTWGSIDRISVAVTSPLARDGYRGWFLSSDPVLNASWFASAYTLDLVSDHFNAASVDPRGCAAPELKNRLVLLDGAKHDRCPWAGDLAVSGVTELLTHGRREPVRNVIAALGGRQQGDGYVPASLLDRGHATRLVDYPAWWLLVLRDYALYTADLSFVRREWPVVTRLLDRWYASHIGRDGLLDFGSVVDYAFLPRAGTVVTYYNANFVRASEAAAELGIMIGDTRRNVVWRRRAARAREAIDARFWDPSAGAYLDSNAGPPIHPEDGNALAVLADVGTADRHASALGYLGRTTRRPWGNALEDTGTWSARRGEVYPFMSYFDVLARFHSGRDAEALDELRRTWGWMLAAPEATGTMWEAIGRAGRVDTYFEAASSLAHGWSTGAVPALTNEVLGVVPTEPGFARFDAVPHPGRLRWAQGAVPTPHGPIQFGWSRGGVFRARLVAPRGTEARLGVPTFGRRVRVWVGPVLAWDGTRGLAYGAWLASGRIYLVVPGGSDVSITSGE